MESTIKQGCGIDKMSELDDSSIDAIITDPPYMTTDLSFDKNGFDLNEFLKESLRVIKPNGYLAIFAPVEMQGVISQQFSTRFSGIWYKQVPTMRTHSAKKPMSKQEIYCVYAHPKHKIKDLTWNAIKNYGFEPYKSVQRNRGFTRKDLPGKHNSSIDRACTQTFTEDRYVCDNPGFRYQTDVIEASNKIGMSYAERTLHPTQKPIKLMSVLIKWLTNEGDVILDPFMGSGTTGVTARQLERKFIGFEIDREYYEIADDRITHAMDNFQETMEL